MTNWTIVGLVVASISEGLAIGLHSYWAWLFVGLIFFLAISLGQCIEAEKQAVREAAREAYRHAQAQVRW